jgi:HK97 family phage major capsid protein
LFLKQGENMDEREEIKIGARNNRSDRERLQQIHDFAVENGAMCDDKSAHAFDTSNPLKTIGKTDDELRVANYLVLFGGRDLTSFSGRGIKPNPDGTLGEFFSPNTDFESNYTKTGMLYVDFEHSLDPDGLGVGRDDVLGYVDWKTAKKDERGLFVERVLNRRQKYVQWLEELIDAGLIGNSSEAVGSQVEKRANGEIVKWGLRRDTLTVNPMEPRMLTGNQLQAVKALAEILPELKSLVTSEAGRSGAEPISKEQAEGDSNQIADVPSAKEPEMNEEIKALFDGFKSELESFKNEVKTVATEAAKEVIAELPEVKTAMNISVTEAAEDRPFKSIAENLVAVRSATVKGYEADNLFPRLRYLKATGASEGVPQDGGLLLDPTLASEILKPIHETGPFSADAKKLPVSGNSNYGWINGVDETSRVTGSRWGGIRGYRLAEAATKTASKPSFRRIQWELKKYAAVVVATDELLADASMFSEIVRTGVTEELNFMLNEDIFDGAGLAGPQGIQNSGAMITVTRTDANKILGADISAMYTRMDLRGRNTANWYISNDAQAQLDNLFAVGSTAVLYPYASIGADGVKRLYGRPIKTTEFNESLGTAGDIVFADMTQYLMWEKGGIEESTSIHVYYLSDETAFRFVYRVDGKSAVNTALSPLKGSTTTSPFVRLLATS